MATTDTIVDTLRASGWKRSASLPLLLAKFKLTQAEATAAAEFLTLDKRLTDDLEVFRSKYSFQNHRDLGTKTARNPADHDTRAEFFGVLLDTPTPEGFARAKAGVREAKTTNTRNAAPWIKSAGARAAEVVRKAILDGWTNDEARSKAVGVPVEASPATQATAQALGVLEARIEAATHAIAPAVDAARELAKLFGAE
ncbi:MAG: hypothetical protein DVB31_09805 [Verrucomicrobia bacterium]|nr:MAG: hypothetical protein DVB31_09805 [Verrucomicrobiota bacterium]